MDIFVCIWVVMLDFLERVESKRNIVRMNDHQAKPQKEPSKRFIKKQLMKIDFI